MRIKAREVALKILFGQDVAGDGTDNDITYDVAVEDEKLTAADIRYVNDTVDGVTQKKRDIDEKIAMFAKDWRVERMTGIDRNILRLAVYEMLFAAKKMKPAIAINEAVELAKSYGTDDSPRFVNGVLGAMMRADKTD